MRSTIAFLSAEIRTAASTTPVTSYVGAPAHCDWCRLRQLCLPAGLAPQAVRLFGSLFSKRVRMRRRESLYRSADPFDAVYAIRLGTFKSVSPKCSHEINSRSEFQVLLRLEYRSAQDIS